MAEPLRILHVFGSLDRGGAETMIMNLYRHIDRAKVQFDFAVCEDGRGAYSDEIEFLGGRIFVIPRLAPGSWFAFRGAFERLFEEHREYRIIHGHLRSSASIYLGIAKKYGLITIAHSHSTSSGRGVAAAAKSLLQRGIRHKADYMIACSDEAGRWLFGNKAVKKDNYFILKNAIDAAAFAFDAEERRHVREDLSCGGRFIIGHIGSFIPVKNHGFTLDVFEEIYKRDETARLLLVGDGSRRGAIETRARERGLEGAVIMTGTRQDIPALLSAMDVFILPSLWEGLPVTAVEAQASGLRCILSDTITHEVEISDLVQFLPLADGAAAWADKIVPFAGGYGRESRTQAVREAGYDILETSMQIQDFYLNLPVQH